VRLTRLININYGITRTHECFLNRAKLQRKIQLYVLQQKNSYYSRDEA